eukprot:356046-Chlamydomonas_euryale.AAC.1
MQELLKALARNGYDLQSGCGEQCEPKQCEIWAAQGGTLQDRAVQRACAQRPRPVAWVWGTVGARGARGILYHEAVLGAMRCRKEGRGTCSSLQQRAKPHTTGIIQPGGAKRRRSAKNERVTSHAALPGPLLGAANPVPAAWPML